MATPALRPSTPTPKAPPKLLQASTAKAALENRLSKQFAVRNLRPTPLRPTPVTKLAPLNHAASGTMAAKSTPVVGPLPTAPIGGQQLPPPAALGVTSLPSPPATTSEGTAQIDSTASERDGVQSPFLANLSMNLSAIEGLPTNAALIAQQFHLTTMFAQAVELPPPPNSRLVTSLRESQLADQTQIFKVLQDITTIKNSPPPQFNGLIR